MNVSDMTGKSKTALSASPKAREALKAFNEMQNDWWKVCPKCGKIFVGTLEELRKPCTHDS